ncbi:uncharacterized protein LOC114857875 [Betta splendens]|uniref:Uncharacterized protein LOC114857875 n=1 Tax=Betta splendens TaxID=158456 RepID=A0A6P7MUJ1_BETSP|nr:uncharacterized protein LOC114857875 [Betta splendens]
MHRRCSGRGPERFHPTESVERHHHDHRGPMEARGPRTDGRPQLLARIIEHVWTHRMLDLQEVLDPAYWPDTDSQPTSLTDSLRLRVASAQVFSIVKNRDVEHFDRVMRFVEATYRLLPGLVTPLKHMKIIFGLKTMVIMWMLRTGRGTLDTVCKIITYFPSKLPQYQDQCNQLDMFLMRKNHLDFKTLAQSLAVDKEKRNDYMKKHMDEQYGEHYAQKLEDRLLQYLHKLEAVLKGDTYVDKILRKSSPATEEDKQLLELVTCDSIAIATTLKKLLHCDFPFCRISQPSGNGGAEMESSQPSSCLYSLKVGLKPRRGEAAHDVATDSTGVSGHHQGVSAGDGVRKVEENSRNKGSEELCERRGEPAASPHFCSRHQRWVSSILHQCPDECSEELLLQANLSWSPPLFHSSSSSSSSQDLTPSNLISSPPDRPPPSQSEQRGAGSGSAGSTSQKAPVPQPSPKDVAPLLSGSTRPSSDHLMVPSDENTPTCSHPHVSPDKDSLINPPESVHLPNLTSRQPLSRLSRKYRQSCTNTRHLEAPRGFIPNPVPQNSTSPHPETHSSRSAPVQMRPHSCGTNTDHLSLRCDSKVSTAATTWSLPSQAELLPSTWLQSYVAVTRLSSSCCYRSTEGRCYAPCDPGGRAEEDDDSESSFDPNTLYSSQSSSSDSDVADDDPEYKPRIKKKRRLLKCA